MQRRTIPIAKTLLLGANDGVWLGVVAQKCGGFEQPGKKHNKISYKAEKKGMLKEWKLLAIWKVQKKEKRSDSQLKNVSFSRFLHLTR